MKSLIAAIQFITVLPVGKTNIYDPEGMIPYFPVVGIILGTLVSIFDQFALLFWPKPVVSLLDVILLIILTGAFHLDGLGDSADGFFSHKSREKALSIMKDSRIGVMGMVAIFCTLSLKWAGITNLDTHRSLLLVLVPAYARGGMIFGVQLLDYGRPDGGTGYGLFQNPMRKTAYIGLLVPVALSIFAGWQGLLLNIVFALSVAAIIVYYKKKMGCITGDMLGGMCEMLEAILFITVSMELAL